MTVIDYYRDQLLRPSLDRIAEQPTRALQRAECLRETLDYGLWRSLYKAINKAKTVLGKGMITHKLKQIWSQTPEQHLETQLAIYYMMAVTVQACIMTLGQAYYRFDEAKNLEIELYRTYEDERLMLDVNIMDLAHQQIEKNYSDSALAIASWKDDYINPIAREMAELGDTIRESIVHDTLDVSAFKIKADQLSAEAYSKLPML
jgi:hypothetical protein